MSLPLAQRIEELVRPSAVELGFEIVRIKLMGGKRPVLQVMAERADGTMSIDDCETLSRTISALLDVADPIASEYRLEVSSPGIDRPLVKLDDFRRFAGFEARVEMKEPIEGRKRFAGRLEGVEGHEVLLDVPKVGTLGLDVALIDEAKLVLTQELIDRALARQGLDRADADAALVDDED